MATGRANRYWIAALVLLLAVIAAGSIVICNGSTTGNSLEITLEPEPEPLGEIYVGGEVASPGYYPLKADDRIQDIIGAAGSATSSLPSAGLKMYVVNPGGEEQPQRISINSAEAWLLEALPGIGETRAQAIVAFRESNGIFRSTDELLKVDGIGTAIYEQIKHLITVSD